jgi:sister chromatid cohesion protein DCC1
MHLATMRPTAMAYCNIATISSFRLLELPPDLCKLIESATDPFSFTVKGQPTDDAVLCTSDKTYALRSVVLSNSILVVTPPPIGASPSSDFESELDLSDDIVIRDQLNEILELVPSVPKLHKLGGLLKGMEYDEGADEDMDVDRDGQSRDKNVLTYEDARAQIQASEVELAHGIRERRILNINGRLRPITPGYLKTILELLLNHLVTLSPSHKAVSVERLATVLVNEHEIPRQVSTQVMSWFGSVSGEKWTISVDDVLKEVGLGILRDYKEDPISEEELIARWKAAVGDTFASAVFLSLLSGNYLATSSIASDVPSQFLKYFPRSSLPVDAPARFADLFLTRSRWKEDEITPFLSDIAVDSKARDKLLLKFARSTTDSEGTWYTARVKYNG